MAKKRAGEGRHHPAGEPERPLPFRVSDREAYDALPEDVRRAVEELYPHFDRLATRFETSGYRPADEWVDRVVGMLDKRLGPVKEHLRGGQFDREALRQLPEPIRRALRETRDAARLQALLGELFEDVPQEERDRVRELTMRALRLTPPPAAE